MPALLDAFLAGGQAGTRDREIRHENQRRSKLGDLMSQAYGAPADQRSGLLSQMAAVDPNSAMSAQKHFGDMDDQRRQRLGQFAAVFDALPDEQKAVAYPQFAAQAKEVLGVPVPDQWDPAFSPRISQIARALGAGGQQAEQFTLGPGSKRFDPSGKVIAEVPFAPANANLVTVPDGQGGAVQMIYDPRTRQLSEPQYPGQGQPAAAAGAAPQIMGDAMSSSMDPQAIQNEFKTLAPQFGAQISSLTRTPERNAAVGGVANSQHLAGTAGDFVVPEANKGAFRQAMQQRGFEVIDEGDHMHVELPPNRKVAQGGPRLGYTPPKAAGGKAPPSGYRYNMRGDLEMIPGGPAEVAAQARTAAQQARDEAAEAKRLQKEQGAQARQAEAATAANDLITAIDRLTESDGFSGLGTLTGDIALNTPLLRNDTKDAQAQLRNISGQVALATMSRLKALSSQGATGFGALSQQELKLLQNSLAALESEDISNAELKRSLKVIRDKMEKAANWKPAGAAPAVDPRRQSLLDKY